MKRVLEIVPRWSWWRRAWHRAIVHGYHNLSELCNLLHAVCNVLCEFGVYVCVCGVCGDDLNLCSV